MADHECHQTDKIEKFTYFSGQTNEAVKSIKSQVDELFDMNKEVLASLNSLKLKTAVETKELKIKYGLYGSMINMLATLAGALAVYFYKK